MFSTFSLGSVMVADSSNAISVGRGGASKSASRAAGAADERSLAGGVAVGAAGADEIMVGASAGRAAGGPIRMLWPVRWKPSQYRTSPGSAWSGYHPGSASSGSETVVGLGTLIRAG